MEVTKKIEKEIWITLKKNPKIKKNAPDKFENGDMVKQNFKTITFENVTRSFDKCYEK